MFSNNIFDMNHPESNQKTMSQILPSLHQEQKSKNNTNSNPKPNLPLLIVDLLLLPIHIFRMILIYFFGSKYNLKGFTFLDVIMHADKPYFNQEDCRLINTLGNDYRVVIRDDSRIFPMDLNNYFKSSNVPPNPFSNNIQCSCSSNHNHNQNNVIVGDISSGSNTSSNQSHGIWDISTDAFEDDKNNNSDDSDSDTDDSDDSNDSNNSDHDSNSNSNFTSDGDKTAIKGVNYFEANDDKSVISLKKKSDILDSIRDELNSAFED